MRPWSNADRKELELMAPQSNPDSTTAGADGLPVDSPSHDDLQALIPDMELLEAGAIDARTTQAAIAAAAGSGRNPVAGPKLSDQNTATTMRIAVPKAVSSDDPYADLMPELEPFDDPAPPSRAIPTAYPARPAGLSVPVVKPPAPVTPPRPAAPPARPTPTAVKPVTAPVAPRPAAA